MWANPLKIFFFPPLPVEELAFQFPPPSDSHLAVCQIGSPGCHVSITADRSQSRLKPMSATESFDPGVKPIHFIPIADKSQMLVAVVTSGKEARDQVVVWSARVTVFYWALWGPIQIMMMWKWMWTKKYILEDFFLEGGDSVWRKLIILMVDLANEKLLSEQSILYIWYYILGLKESTIQNSHSGLCAGDAVYGDFMFSGGLSSVSQEQYNCSLDELSSRVRGHSPLTQHVFVSLKTF